MIQGNRASHYVVTQDANGKRVERELRQCSHCQTTWLYIPGSGNVRRICMQCMGMCCNSPACNAMASGKCAPFSAVVESGDARYVMSEAGVMVPR